MNVAELLRDLQAVPNPAVTTVVAGAGATVIAAGDFTGGASEDLFTATAHGFEDDDVVALVAESAAGVVTGAVGDTFVIGDAAANTFRLYDSAGTLIENTADGTAVFARVSGATVDTSGATEGGIELTDGGTVLIG